MRFRPDAYDIPLIAIGGYAPQRATGAFGHGADSVCVVTDERLSVKKMLVLLLANLRGVIIFHTAYGRKIGWLKVIPLRLSLSDLTELYIQSPLIH